MIKTTMENLKIEPLYGATNQKKLDSLINEMRKNGWKNIPAIVVLETATGYTALSGSHRYEAAVQCDLDIEVELYQENEIKEIFSRSDVDGQAWKMLSGIGSSSNNSDRIKRG